MARFENVKDAYIAMAPTLSPDQFPVWADKIQAFGDAMGRMDYPGACAALDEVVVALELTAAGADAPQAGDSVTGKAGGQTGGGKSGTSDAGISDSGTSDVAPAASSGAETPAPAAAPAPADAAWKECPRGRCRG